MELYLFTDGAYSIKRSEGSYGWILWEHNGQHTPSNKEDLKEVARNKQYCSGKCHHINTNNRAELTGIYDGLNFILSIGKLVTKVNLFTDSNYSILVVKYIFTNNGEIKNSHNKNLDILKEFTLLESKYRKTNIQIQFNHIESHRPDNLGLFYKLNNEVDKYIQK